MSPLRLAALMSAVTLFVTLGGCHVGKRPVSACVGDCDGDGAITAADFVRVTGIDLGKVPFEACKVLDANGDGQFSADERIQMVRNYSDGCGHASNSTE